jgi:hypothetical protein
VLAATVVVKHGGKTTLTSAILHTSLQIRDAVINSGMARGVAGRYDTLAEWAASIA